MVNDRLMAGTLGGLSVLESGVVRVSYTTSNSPLRHNWVTAIARSGSDAFVGTYGAGVIQLSADGTWRSFPGRGFIRRNQSRRDGSHAGHMSMRERSVKGC